MGTRPQFGSDRVKISGDWMDAMGKALEKKQAPARPTKKRAKKKASKKKV